jgi:hypothetical protein
MLNHPLPKSRKQDRIPLLSVFIQLSFRNKDVYSQENFFILIRFISDK